jgi:tetratricopeptide (TPR) repeat protein
MRAMVRSLPVVLAVWLFGPGDLAARGAQGTAPWEADLAEGQRLFGELDYEHAVPVLTRAILALEPMAGQQPAAKTALVGAYGLRARALFGLDDSVKAQDDFRALLALSPAFELSGQVSPRVVALFAAVKKEVVGALALSVDPPDATVEANGQAISIDPAGMPLTAGEYTVKATRVGFKPAEERVSVTAGETKQFSITLERTSSVLFVVTVPPDVEVIVDGLARGRTAAGPLPPAYQEVPASLGVAPELVSQPFVLGDLTQGAHVIQYRKACHVTDERRLSIEKPTDYREDPVRLRPAVGSIVAESTPSGASVFVDGERRGTTPSTVDDVCEGTRTIELRGAGGRLRQRAAVKTGETIEVRGALKPAFALLAAGSAVTAGVLDRRADVERALSGTGQVTLFVPGGREAEEVPMPPEWLAFDAGRRPIGAAAALNAAARRDLSTKFARALDVQGIAAVSQPSPGSTDLVVAVLAAGAGEPDVVPVTLERTDSVATAVGRFNFVPPLWRRAIGLLTADVLDVDGLVIARVDPGSPAEGAGIKPGDLLVRADGQPVSDSAGLQQLIDSKRPGEPVAIETRDRTGTARTIQVPVTDSPRLMSVADQGLLFNPISLALRSRLDGAASKEQGILRLNLGVALMRLGDYAGARAQLEAVELAAGPGISLGTQQYLLGLTYESEGNAASAAKAFEAARSSGGLLTEDGPAIAVLAERKLNGTARTPSAP